MFQVEVDFGVEKISYRVMFTRGDDAVVCVFSPLNDRGLPDIEYSIGGVAFKSPKDAFDWTKGRKVAFARVVAALQVSKDERTKLWAEFTKRYVDNQPKNDIKLVLKERVWIPE